MWPQVDPVTQLEIDVCPQCHGVWLDAAELAVFLRSASLKERFMWHPDTAQTQQQRDAVRAGRRRCPRCHYFMEGIGFAGVTLDCCVQCEGLWFDDGELRLVVERYKRGMREGHAGLLAELEEGLASEATSAPARGLLERLKGLCGR